MPKLPIAPVVRLTRKQLAEALRRTAIKEGITEEAGAATKVISRFRDPTSVMRKEMGQYTPEALKEYGTLMRVPSEEGVRGMRPIERYPIEKARKKFYDERVAAQMQNRVEMYTPGKAVPTPIKVMRPAALEDESNIGMGVAYELQKDIQVDTPEAFGEYLKTSPMVEYLHDGQQANRLWMIMKGESQGDFTAQRLWNFLRRGSPQKRHYKSSFEYFKSCFVNWRQYPKKFTKNHPKEAKLLRLIMEEYGEGIPEIPVPPPPTPPSLRRKVLPPKPVASGPPKTMLRKKGVE